MSTHERITSSRANGAKSHGPITPDGKKRSSQNATTHGIFSDCLLLEAESTECFDELMRAHRDRFQPADLVEYGIVEEMCAAKWRLYRVLVMETNSLEAQIDIEPGVGSRKIASAFNTVAPSSALLHRYEAHLQRMYQRAIRTLILLRTVARPDPALTPFDLAGVPSPEVDSKNEPSSPPDQPAPVVPDPAPEVHHPTQAADSEVLVIPDFGSPAPSPAPHPASPPNGKEPGGAV